jgi:hypothetical protein
MSVSCMYHIYSNRYICTYRKGRGRSSKRCLSVDTYILGANVCAVKGGDSNSGSLVEEKKIAKGASAPEPSCARCNATCPVGGPKNGD